jgi:hypothetical protein
MLWEVTNHRCLKPVSQDTCISLVIQRCNEKPSRQHPTRGFFRCRTSIPQLQSGQSGRGIRGWAGNRLMGRVEVRLMGDWIELIRD